MSASAKPTERAFKSLLAVVLAVSLCPLMPAKEAQAQEAKGGGNEMSVLSASVDDSDAQSGDADGAAAPQSDESGDPIVDWTTSGTARWMIDASGGLVIAPLEGEESGELENWRLPGRVPWHDNSSLITSAKVEGAIAISTAEYMFEGCPKLKSLDLSGLDTSKVTSTSHMFEGCSKLKSLDLSGLDASKVTDMSFMFYYCPKLTSLDLSPLDASKVTSTSYMFEGCSKLTSLDLSGLDASKVTSMYSMFRDCSSLTSLDLSPLDASSATGMSSMFRDCSSLTSLDLSSLDTSSAENTAGMFSGCSALRKVTLGEKFSFEDPGSFWRGYLPAPEGESLTGKWLSWADGKAYAPEDIPNNVAATYGAERSFADVDYGGDWYADAVTFASSRGLITGYSDSGEFGPLDTLTRGQLATILWRNACPDEAASYDPSKAENKTGLDGIADHEYYTEAANWAFAKGVITGFERPDGTFDFAAGDPVSFEQMVTIVSRLGAKPGEVAAAGDDLSRFADGDAASPWSRGPIAWAAEKGLVGGYENADGTRTLAPGEDVQRGRAATILMRAFDLGIMK